MAYVLDASFAASWFLPDEASEATDKLLSKVIENRPVVPGLFRHELLNVLLTAERRGRVTAADVDGALATVSTLPISVSAAADDRAVLRLARAHALTAYDATYLALALAERLPLATLDKRLAKAALGENVALLGPVKP
ncbi:putative nucleic acid-binding protein [Roseiarcus fermentans]|uniref:Ribonuclease VapC n=1 Tax=Roseiarcus fermentans TaxID=1473586 RepID=A0A366FI54_9HYPH|nr:type II toxin-antitoxin system VapC family toxin [Roseiarcus fermentans]RBP14271.1 putative nucleic acid-binding protein [Roseiarcus fermentans]